MKYQDIYEQINGILKIINQGPIDPIVNCSDEKMQIDHLYEKYTELYFGKLPQWRPFKDKPQIINDIGIQLLLKVKGSV